MTKNAQSHCLAFFV